ncbi:MAG: hypothetical protein E7638_00665 [Ruminococcaceae bacterium]|nr:hypothetical protein [Oscillospiraceae bacterium]
MKQFVRYGSIAACFFLLLGITLGISPLIDRAMTKNTAAEADASLAAEDVYAYAAVGTTSTTAYSAEMSKTEAKTNGSNGTAADENTEEAPAVMKSFLQSTPSFAADKAAPPVDDCDAVSREEVCEAEEYDLKKQELTEKPTAALDSGTGNGANCAAAPEAMADAISEESGACFPAEEGITLDSVPTAYASAETCFACTMHGTAAHSSYHLFTDELIAYVGEDAFDAWYSTEEAADECGIPSVASMVRYFGIDREAFVRITEGSGIYYSLETIFPE